MSIHKDKPPYQPQDVIAGKYRVEKIVGEGGMSVIYGCTDVSCGKQVAVKTFRPSVARERSFSADDMRREAEVLVQLHERTAFVVEVLTAGITQDRHKLPYFVMEWLRGETLRQHIRERQQKEQRFEINDVAASGIDLAVALVHAHALGVIHRDLKPENFFIARDRDGTYGTKLLDFGVSATVHEAAATGSGRVFVGSRPYAAPEQLQGEAVTVAADIYSLGLILYEMLTFALPHDRRNRELSPEHIAANAYGQSAPRVSALRPDVLRRLDDLVASCLAWAPKKRPNAERVAKQLRAVNAEFEGKLLGSDDIASTTDVDGTVPAGVLQERMAEARRRSLDPQVIRSDRAVSLTATTKPPVDSEQNAVPTAQGDESEEQEILAARPTTRPADINATRPDGIPLGAREQPAKARTTERIVILSVESGSKPPSEAHPAPPTIVVPDTVYWDPAKIAGLPRNDSEGPPVPAVTAAVEYDVTDPGRPDGASNVLAIAEPRVAGPAVLRRQEDSFAGTAASEKSRDRSKSRSARRVAAASALSVFGVAVGLLLIVLVAREMASKGQATSQLPEEPSIQRATPLAALPAPSPVITAPQPVQAVTSAASSKMADRAIQGDSAPPLSRAQAAEKTSPATVIGPRDRPQAGHRTPLKTDRLDAPPGEFRTWF